MLCWRDKACRHHQSVVCCCCMLFCSMLFSFGSQAASSIRVALAAEDYPPFYYQNADGDMDGFSVKVLQAVSEQLQLSLSWQRLPWNRVIQHLQQGRADLVMVMYYTDSRAEQFIFTEVSYLQDELVLLCHRPCPVHFSGDLKDILLKELALVRGFSYGKVLDAMPLQAVKEVESDQLLMQLVAHGRLKLGLVSHLTLRHSPLLPQYRDALDVLRPAVSLVDIYFAFSQQSSLRPEHIHQFNQALADFVASSDYGALRAKYSLE